MVYKKTPFVQGSDFELESAELLPACLINLLPESYGAPPLSLNHLATFLEAPGVRGWCF
jgi:hypothetical protein